MTNSSTRGNRFYQRLTSGPALVLTGYTVLIVFWFRHYFTTAEIPSVDLSGHILAIEDLAAQLPWRLTYYAPHQFTGWPAFQFYAFITHLLAAVLSIILSPFVADSARLAAYLIMVATAAALPAAIYYCARPLIDEQCTESSTDDASRRKVRTLLAYSCGAFGFWFLNHDGQWFGVGAASTMNIGLFSHGAGLLVLMINLGDLFRLLLTPVDDRRIAKNRRIMVWPVRRLALSFALIFLVHSLSAIVALAAGVFAVIWYPQHRRRICAAYGLGLAIPAFWTIPHLAFAGDYVGLDIIRDEGDFLTLFFRYPFWWLFRGLIEIRYLVLPKIDPTNLVLVAVTLFLLIDQRIRRSRLIIPFFTFVLGSVLVFSSKFIAHSIPLGLHYYRFSGYSFLILTMLFAAVAVVPAIGAAGPLAASRRPIWLMLIAFGITAAQILLPHYERGRVIAETGPGPHGDEAKVLEYFRNRPDKGRVLFQYFNDYKKYPWLDAHYLPSHLYKDTGFEPLNGVFIQSSASYVFPASSASGLGLPTFNTPFVFLQGSTLNDTTRTDQLRSFGVTDMVVGDDKVDRLRPLARGPIAEFGPFRIVPIAKKPAPVIAPIHGGPRPKRIVGYRDLNGDLPFRYLEYYFFSRQDLYPQFELVDLDRLDYLPPGLDGVLVNSLSDDLAKEPYVRKVFRKTPDKQNSLGENPAELEFPLPLLRVRYRRQFPINHYSVWYQDNYQVDDYQAIAKVLDGNRTLRKSLFELPLPAPQITSNQTAPVQPAAEQVVWSPGSQAVEISGLKPGEPYRFDFSYFPYWQSADGELLRGSAERMVIVPRDSSMRLYYSRTTFPSTWIGDLITVFALAVLFFYRSKDPQNREG